MSDDDSGGYLFGDPREGEKWVYADAPHWRPIMWQFVDWAKQHGLVLRRVASWNAYAQ